MGNENFVVGFKFVLLGVLQQSPINIWIFKIFILFICAYNVWVISTSFAWPPPLPTPPAPSLTPPYPSLPSRNYFALISNFVEERVWAIIGRTKGFC
jgi:hypothetical protein